MKAILEIEMPESCILCPIIDYDEECGDYCCPATDKINIWLEEYSNKRHPDCPLKPVCEKQAPTV